MGKGMMIEGCLAAAQFSKSLLSAGVLIMNNFLFLLL